MWRITGEILRLYRLGVRTFLCGMAAGTEIQAAEAVLALRDSLLPDLCLSQAERERQEKARDFLI